MLREAAFTGGGYDKSMIMTLGGAKWYTGIDAIYLVVHDVTGIPKVVTKYTTASKDLDALIIPKLSKQHATDYKELGCTFLDVNKSVAKNGSDVMTFTNDVTDCKIGKTELKVSGTFQIVVDKNSAISLKLLSLRAKELHY
jgi:hypothetical protein